MARFLPRRRSADRCFCLARTSASLDSHRTSARRVVRVVEHPVRGREAH